MALSLKIEDEPLFDSAYAALCFAFRYSTEQYPMSPMARLMRGQIGSGKGLFGLQAAAQSGFIRAEVEKLPVFERCALVARFAIDKERYSAMNELIRPATASLGTGVHNRRLVDNLVQKFYGKRVYLQEVYEQYPEVNRKTLSQHWAMIRKHLTNLEYRAIDRIEIQFQEAGLVPW